MKGVEGTEERREAGVQEVLGHDLVRRYDREILRNEEKIYQETFRERGVPSN